MLTPDRRIALLGRIATALPTAGVLHPLLADCMSALADDHAPAPNDAVPGEFELLERAPEAHTPIATMLRNLPFSRRLGWVVTFASVMGEGPRLNGAELASVLNSFLANVEPDRWTTPYFRGFCRKLREQPPAQTMPSMITDDLAWDSGLVVVGLATRGALSSEQYAQLAEPVKAGLKRCGGWIAIRDAQARELPFRRRDYLAGFRSAE